MTATTHPRPPMPLVAVASAALLVVVAAASALARRPDPPALATATAIAALVPWRRSNVMRAAGSGIALVVVAWAIATLLRAGDLVSAHNGGEAAALVVALMRFAALRTEAASAWCDPRFTAGTTAEVKPLGDALRDALDPRSVNRAPAVDAAVVAIARARPEDVPRDDAARRLFFCDVYGVLALHARRGRASPRAPSFVESFRVRYEAFGDTLSPDEVEHAILRGNRRHPAFLSLPFADDDPRARWVVPLDPRVHFVLHCGMRSCPPMRSVAGEDPEQALAAAANELVRSETTIDDRARTIETTAILRRHAGDFGGEEGIRSAIARYSGRDPADIAGYAIRYSPWDLRPTGRLG